MGEGGEKKILTVIMIYQTHFTERWRQRMGEGGERKILTVIIIYQTHFFCLQPLASSMIALQTFTAYLVSELFPITCTCCIQKNGPYINFWMHLEFLLKTALVGNLFS